MILFGTWAPGPECICAFLTSAFVLHTPVEITYKVNIHFSYAEKMIVILIIN